MAKKMNYILGFCAINSSIIKNKKICETPSPMSCNQISPSPIFERKHRKKCFSS